MINLACFLCSTFTNLPAERGEYYTYHTYTHSLTHKHIHTDTHSHTYRHTQTLEDDPLTHTPQILQTISTNMSKSVPSNVLLKVFTHIRPDIVGLRLQ